MDWWAENKISREPDDQESRAEFKCLSEHIRDWHPSFKVGDMVRRHNPLGSKMIGVVRGFRWKGTHLCAMVDMPNHTETFHAAEYVSC